MTNYFKILNHRLLVHAAVAIVSPRVGDLLHSFPRGFLFCWCNEDLPIPISDSDLVYLSFIDKANAVYHICVWRQIMFHMYTISVKYLYNFCWALATSDIDIHPSVQDDYICVWR